MNRLRIFYVILITQTLSLIGSRMTAIGVGLWLFARTGNTTPLLLMAFFIELPGMLGGSLAGVLVDRWDRRSVLLMADAGQAAGTLLLMGAIFSGRFQLWHLYIIVFLQGIFAIVQGPAKDATTTTLVDAGHRDRANAIREMAFPLAGVIAPALAGMVYALAGIGAVILVDLATFVVAAIAIYVVRLPRPLQTAEGRSAQGTLWQEWAGGVRFLARRPSLLALVLYLTLVNFLLNGPLELAIPYLITITGREALTGLLLGVMSLGALTGATLMAVWGGARRRVPALLAGMLLTGLMFLLYGTVRTPLLLALTLFLLMIPLPISNALFLSILQLKTPPDMQGRIFAAVGQLGFLGATTSFLLVGPLVDRLLEPAVSRPAWRLVAPLVGSEPGSGMGLLLVATGLIILAATVTLFAVASVRRLESILPDYIPAES